MAERAAGRRDAIYGYDLVNEASHHAPAIPGMERGARTVRSVGRDGVRIRRAYREAYGRTVCRGIQEARLREVQKLLQRTRVPIGAIGPMCGFGNEFCLKTLFKARFGMTMREWRKTHAN